MAAALHGFHFFPSVSFQLFTAAFPLAPLIALLTNAIDMKVDARRLLWTNRRPVAFRAEDIGGWSGSCKICAWQRWALSYPVTTWESCGIADACLSVWVVFRCDPIIFCFKTYHRDLLQKVIYLFIFGNFRRTRGAPWKNRSGVPFVRGSPRIRFVSTAIWSYYTVISWFGAQIQRRQKKEAKTIKKQHSQKHIGLNVIPTHDRNCTAHC